MRCLSRGPLADVYQAYDTIEGKRVALKLPKGDKHAVDDFVHEVRVAARLVHDNILPVKDASYIGEHFVIAMALAEESLADRIERRMSLSLTEDLAAQAIAAVAHAHQNRIIHCDIKPENYLVFPGNRLKLCDFGFAKISARTVKASGSGTIDYIAPEQAMGWPKMQSDVFSLGLVLYRMFSGQLPEWPFDWPPPGFERLKTRVHPDYLRALRKAIELNPERRYRDAAQLQAAVARIPAHTRKPRRRGRRSTPVRKTRTSWRRMQWREFKRSYNADLHCGHDCRSCGGPVAEAMQFCPWCAADNPTRGAGTKLPAQCPRCDRGVKLDWNNCAWCYGPGYEPETARRYSDRLYTHRCQNKQCNGQLMRFMRYCPWCKTRVQRQWSLKKTRKRCSSCRWGIVDDMWNYCAWCKKPVKGSHAKRGKHG